MKNHFNKCLFVCALFVSCMFASCDKEDDRQSFEAVGRVATYYVSPVVRVRMDYRGDLEGMADVLFPYDVACLEVIRKEARHTDDCPSISWDEYAEAEGVGAE